MKQYTLHHSTGESFSSYRSSALRWEHQQRLYLELNGSKKLFSLQGSDETAGTDVQSKDGEVVEPEEEGNLAGLKGAEKGRVFPSLIAVSGAGRRDMNNHNARQT